MAGKPGVAFALGLGASLLLLLAFGFVQRWALNVAGGDFSAIWAGPHVLVHGGDPYDPATFGDASAALGVMPSAVPIYIYPGWVAVLLAPLGALPLGGAAVLWTLLSVVVAALGLAALLRAFAPRLPAVHAALGFALLGSEAGIVAFYSGQLDLPVVGCVALAMAWLARGHQARAGVAAAAMLLKPQLFLVALPAMVVVAVARGRRRFVWSLAMTAAALVAVSLLMLPRWPVEWLAQVPAARSADPRAVTLPNAVAQTLGPAATPLAYAAVALVGLAALLFHPRSRGACAAWLAVAPLLTPYVWVYDHVLGVIPLAMATGVAAERGRPRGILIALSGTLIMTVLATWLHAYPGLAHATLSFNAYAQLALAVLVLAAVWHERGPRGV